MRCAGVTVLVSYMGDVVPDGQATNNQQRRIYRFGYVNPILTRRDNTLFPRQPIRRTWGQLGEQLDRVVGAAGFVHRRKTKEATVSE